MALDLDLPASYAKLLQAVMDQSEERDMEVEGRLMRESRVWFESFVLENMWVSSHLGLIRQGNGRNWKVERES
jgi:hypothetical protein